MRIRTANHLQRALDAESGWRIQELGIFKAAIIAAVEPRRTVLIRAAVPLAYAHWEGFIKKAASSYGAYLSGRGVTYEALKPCFMGVEALALVSRLHAIERKIATASNLLSQLAVIDEKVVSIDLWPRLKEVGNLNHSMLMEIVEFLGLTAAHYTTKSIFIDEVLVRTRNQIAHGHREVLDSEAVIGTITETISLIEVFKSDIENAVSSATWQR